ncbi:toll-like receptor 8 [Argopecten irradians]|uniref:toll-like receptor 8 n=1 Tax=Argopecten irradians TaxID=31199 RepID=UPI00371179CD
MGLYLSLIVFCFQWTLCYSGIVTDCCSVYRNQVNCPRCRLESIPQNIGKNTTSLSLTYNNIKALKNDNGLISVRGNNLKVLDISNQLSSFSCSGHRLGNFSRLEEFVMSEIDCSMPHPTMFIEMQNLTKLTARSCLLNNNGMFYSQNLFKSLRHLAYVDLSSNQIAHLNASIFEDQADSMKTLIFANNLIDNLPVQTLEIFKSLELFDLRNNFISSLSYSEYSVLETYRSVSNRIKIKLAGNPLSCDCSNLDFLTWVDTTSVIDDKDDLVCIQNNIKVVTFLETLRDFRVECASPVWLIVSISLALGFCVSGILLRFAWRHSVGLRIWCRQPVEQDTFTYDVFISYCSKDCGWIRKTFTTWLDRHGIRYSAEDKTFDTGRDIYDNIMDAIDDSYQSVCH